MPAELPPSYRAARLVLLACLLAAVALLVGVAVATGGVESAVDAGQRLAQRVRGAWDGLF